MAIGFNPPGIWAPRGRAFSQRVIAPAGHTTIHVTGQVAWDEHSNVVGPGDVRAQMVKSIENIEAILGEVGGTLDDILIEGTDLPAATVRTIDRLVAAKSQTREMGSGPRISALDRLIAAEIAAAAGSAYEMPGRPPPTWRRQTGCSAG